MAWYSAENKRRNLIVLYVGAAVFLGIVLYIPVIWTDLQYERREEARKEARREASKRREIEQKADREVKVTDRYDLKWPARAGAPEFRMTIPVAEFGAWRAGRNPTVHETIQGPDSFELVLPLPKEQRLAKIVLFRDEVKPGMGGHGERLGSCVASFELRGRFGTVQLEENPRCAGAFKTMKAEAIEEARERVEQLIFESGTPPSAQMQLERVRAVLETCKAIAAVSRAANEMGTANHEAYGHMRLLCGYTTAFAHSLLKQSPAEASELVLASMSVDASHSGGWDYFYLEDVLAALNASGHAEDSLAITAHALRAKQRNDSSKPEIAQAKRESLDALFALAPKLAADDPVQELVRDSLSQQRDLDDATRLKVFEVARIRHEKAAAIDPASDLALKTRFHACNGALYAPVPEERKRLGRCADDFLALWQSRVASGKGLEAIGQSEASLGYMLPVFWSSYAYTTQDFRGGLAGIRRVKAYALKRLPTAANAWMYAEVERMEKAVAEKADLR
jgi:hypothetical protein